MIVQMASKGHTTNYIASVIGVSERTIRNRFMPELRKGRSWRNSDLRAKQYEVAMAGNPTMLIWLGKQFLGQKDKTEQTVKTGATFGLGEPQTNAESKPIVQ